MTAPSTARTAAAIIGMLAISALTLQSASANYPHLPEFGVACESCHFASGGTYPNDTDCLGCHDGSFGPMVVGHSSDTTSNKYGSWHMNCMDCHNGMYQWQFRDYGAEAYIFSGTSDVDGITEMTLTMTGANWIPDEFVDYQLIPNLIVDDTYSYRIVGNTEDTIIVDEPIYLPSVTTGDTFFAVIYGRLVRTSIDTPNGGPKPVKFFENFGSNSFADGDTTFDGVCEVCHTLTNHHRTDGNAPGDFDASSNFIGHNDGTKCTDCHLHSAGFQVSCGSCHDYPPTSGSHWAHVNPGTADYYNIECSTCHYDAIHESGAVEIAEGDLYMKISRAPMTFDSGVCSNSCHFAAVWGGEPLTCYDCHTNLGFGGPAPPPQAAPTILPVPDIESLTDLLVTLEWLPTPPAYGPGSYTEYFVEIQEDSEAGIWYPANTGWITDTSWSLMLETGQSWIWRITARDAARPLIESETQTDVFVITAPGAPTVPVIDPEPDINAGQPQNVTLTWSEAIDPEGDPVEYRVEIGYNPWFRSSAPSHLSDWISDTQYTFTTSCEGLYWRVRSRDAAHGAISPWSPADYFQDVANCGGSCPILYAWNGSTFAFESDLNGTGMLAMRSSSGVWKPNPVEHYVLQTEPTVTDGHYELRLVEERYEVNYLDEFRFYAVDVPADRVLYAQKPSFTTPFDGLEQHLHTASRDLTSPASAVHVNTGLDVSEVTAVSDQDYLVLNDDRNLGFDYQTIELDLGNLYGAPQIKLIIDALSAFPSTPEGTARLLDFGPRTGLEVLDASGDWVGVPISTAELPMPPEFKRPFALDVTNIFTTDVYKVRLTFLFKTYVDSIRVDTTADEPVTLTEIHLANAELRSYGHSDESPVIDDVYEYEYKLDEPNHEHDYYPGSYTRYGPVKTLLREIDDQFVIYGSGDEIALRFNPPSPPPSGVTRSYVLYSHGYYKVARNGVPATVEPLPFADMSNFPYDESVEHYPDSQEHTTYRRTFNTRTEP
jgi:hypothetical protein